MQYAVRSVSNNFDCLLALFFNVKGERTEEIPTLIYLRMNIFRIDEI